MKKMKRVEEKTIESAIRDNMRSDEKERKSKKMLFEWKQDFAR